MRCDAIRQRHPGAGVTVFAKPVRGPGLRPPRSRRRPDPLGCAAMTIAALLMAAGRGTRFGADQPKQYLLFLGRPVLRHAAEALLAEGGITLLQPVCAAGEEARVAAILAGLPALPPVAGGETRQASVRAGLE